VNRNSKFAWPKDEKKAFELFLVSAKNGCSSGQYYLGYCYENGIETEKNVKDAIRWYEICKKRNKE
jgi:TPR repeat protein